MSKKIVIKVGTSALTQGSRKLSRKYMLDLTRQLAYLHERNHHVILVSSGAVAAGREMLGHIAVDRLLPAKQMFAAVGQVQLMHIWTQLFSLFEIPVGQLLLTKEDISHRKRYLNARDTLSCLLQHKIIPIINENDSIATQEIKVGDNDNLAALVANLIGADLLVLLTDQEGLYTADPRINPQAELISVVHQVDEHVFALAKGSSTTLGTGGMTTKLEAAKKAAQCGVATVIASASMPNVLVAISEGRQVGTMFLTDITPQGSKKRWLLSEQPQGIIYVDDGAASKIAHHGASLLPSGITKTKHSFERGAIVHIMGPAKIPLAVGITNYGNLEIQELIGKHSDQIEDILGYSYGLEIVHRTHMARIKSHEE